MNISRAIITFTFATALAACASTTAPPSTDRLTRAEAKSFACPESVLEAGANSADCNCVEERLYDIGRKPGAIQYDPAPRQSEIGTSAGRRDIAIGLLRLEAFEQCGLFDLGHPVSKNL